MKLQRNMELFETELLRLCLIRAEIKLLLMFACLYKSSRNENKIYVYDTSQTIVHWRCFFFLLIHNILIVQCAMVFIVSLN